MLSFESLGARPILYSLNLLRIHPDTHLAKNMTQVLILRGSKITFRMFEENLVLRE